MPLVFARAGCQVLGVVKRHSNALNWPRLITQAQPHVKPLTAVLIANRGEIALRINRTASQCGLKATTLYTDPDARSQHAMKSKYSINIGDHSAYLDGDRIIEAARTAGCDCIHPGYGFLSENSDFAQKCADSGIVFIGPSPHAIEAMGNKSRSKEIMTAAGVPCIPGYHGTIQDPDCLLREAQKLGFPVLLKAVKGGGGKGMRVSTSSDDFLAQLDSAKSEARSSFGDDSILVEKFITTPRHIEVQIFSDKHGNCVALGERDCSVQRRYQKIIEESPAPDISTATRKNLWQKARDAALAVGYEGAGTVEFIFDNANGDFFFMEMNTRLQVEHPVTEMITGQDLVHWQFQIAEGRELPLTQEQVEDQIAQNGWAFEARIYAEDPDRNFIPDSGTVLFMQQPYPDDDVRVDSGVVQGDCISPYYDPMIAKLIVRGSTREEALKKLLKALQEYQIAGLATNIDFLKRICTSPDFISGLVETGYIEKHKKELFTKQSILPEVWAQAAIGIFLQDLEQTLSDDVKAVSNLCGLDHRYYSRQIKLHSEQAIGQASKENIKVFLRQKSHAKFDIEVGNKKYADISATLIAPNQIQCFFPHGRLTSNIVQNGSIVHVFHEGKQYDIHHVQPTWMKNALGRTNVANNVVAPMPCKVLRVNVAEGGRVCKDEPLIVIESMKMETIIRSPQDGNISKILHQAGDICKAGATLVEFEDNAAI